MIETPRGKIVTGKNGKAQLIWDTKFVDRWSGKYSRAQKFVDSEVLRLSEPYIPLKTSMLIKSGILGTKVGSGLVQWIAPYAKRQYYKGRQPGTSATGALRGRLWFERMKAASLKTIIDGAKKFMAQGSGQ
jgi:hypothetical protein